MGLLFNEWLEECHRRETRLLRSADEVSELYRKQGSIGILEVILSLPGDIRRYKKDLAEGKIKPLMEVSNGQLVR